ncbi:MAG: ABC transporter permease [Chloroflexi bacterium]|nr:ABC transporter permease [Chloroflexota bacterium]
MTSPAVPMIPASPPSHLRPIPPRSLPRRVWDRIGWNVALLLEIVAIIVIAQILAGGLTIDGVVIIQPLLNPQFTPPPTQIWDAFSRLADRNLLFDNIWFSLSNFAIGFVLAAIVGIMLGLMLGTISTVRTLLGPVVWVAYATPRVAIAPLIVMWLGFGAESKIVVIFLMAVFPIIINVWVGASSVDQTLLRAGRVFGASNVQLYRKVTLPYILPYTLTGLRLGIARGLIGVVIAEFIGSAAGIGYMIRLLSSEFDLAGALALTLVLMVTANVAMILLDLIRRRLAPWYREGAI